MQHRQRRTSRHLRTSGDNNSMTKNLTHLRCCMDTSIDARQILAAHRENKTRAPANKHFKTFQAATPSVSLIELPLLLTGVMMVSPPASCAVLSPTVLRSMKTRSKNKTGSEVRPHALYSTCDDTDCPKNTCDSVQNVQPDVVPLLFLVRLRFFVDAICQGTWRSTRHGCALYSRSYC